MDYERMWRELEVWLVNINHKHKSTGYIRAIEDIYRKMKLIEDPDKYDGLRNRKVGN